MVLDQVGEATGVALPDRPDLPRPGPPVELQRDDDALRGEAGDGVVDQFGAGRVVDPGGRRRHLAEPLALPVDADDDPDLVHVGRHRAGVDRDLPRLAG
ncbi:hypothetical protein QCD66_09975 [Polymorphospora sp. A560]